MRRQKPSFGGTGSPATGKGIKTELPSHIPPTDGEPGTESVGASSSESPVQPLREGGVGPGAGIFTAQYEHSRTGFGAVGKLEPAEQVAAIATGTSEFPCKWRTD